MEKQHVCPWWLGFLLINPLRKIAHNPEKILAPYIHPGMKVADYGSAMGYFSLPMARMIGSGGKVYCFDIQQKMLEKLLARSKKAHLEEIIESCLITANANYNRLDQSIDFALLFAVAHEVPDRAGLFSFLAGILKPGASLLFAEPKGHVKIAHFSQSLDYATNAGFSIRSSLQIKNNHAVLLVKK